jgi:hypothetical protein
MSVRSGISISLRDFDQSVEDAYRTLFAGDPDKSAELLNWRFRLNPHGPPRFAVASRGDEVVGMIALVPTRPCNASGARLGYQAIDTVVHPSCRGQGLFVKMGTLAQDPVALGGNVLWGFPNANAAPGWYRRHCYAPASLFVSTGAGPSGVALARRAPHSKEMASEFDDSGKRNAAQRRLPESVGASCSGLR